MGLKVTIIMFIQTSPIFLCVLFPFAKISKYELSTTGQASSKVSLSPAKHKTLALLCSRASIASEGLSQCPYSMMSICCHTHADSSSTNQNTPK